MSKIKDTEYLSISAALRARETHLLNRERMERMVDARSGEESAKVLAECGYPELPALTSRALDEMLSQARAGLYRELKGAVPDPGLVEVFQMKYDYHNAKVLVKAAALGIDAGRLLMEGGRWNAAQIKDAFQRDSLRDFADPFRQAVAQARENAALNGLSDRVEFREADVFELLPSLVERGEKYDVVVLDPPAFTKSRNSIKNAVKGYREINIRGMKLVKEGGFLATCSCSHFMDFELFTKTIREAARSAHVRLRQVEFRTQAPDHPILWAADESYYLKFYIFQVCKEK